MCNSNDCYILLEFMAQRLLYNCISLVIYNDIMINMIKATNDCRDLPMADVAVNSD